MDFKDVWQDLSKGNLISAGFDILGGLFGASSISKKHKYERYNNELKGVIEEYKSQTRQDDLQSKEYENNLQRVAIEFKLEDTLKNETLNAAANAAKSDLNLASHGVLVDEHLMRYNTARFMGLAHMRDSSLKLANSLHLIQNDYQMDNIKAAERREKDLSKITHDQLNIELENNDIIETMEHTSNIINTASHVYEDLSINKRK